MMPPGYVPSMVPAEEMVPLADTSSAGDRRGGDRRQRPTPMLCRETLFGGRRGNVRRRTERSGSFVDSHGPGLLSLCLLIVLLNVLDAWFTLLYLAHGGREMNPFVQHILDWSTLGFLAFKTMGIGVCVAYLVLTKNFLAARIGLAVVVAGYLALLGWHLSLLHYVQ
jgi:Domain of unknown function (DUF5658)